MGLCVVFLAGCGKKEDAISSFIHSRMEDAVMNESAIAADASYVRYEQISEEEVISDEGFFYSDEVDYSVLEDTDAVHVTFAVNSYITVQYYDDPAMTSPLNEGGAYLHAGDCIYADIQEIHNPNTEAYQFSDFEVWEYNEDGQKEEKLESASSEDGLVYQIPTDFQGREIAIVPLGEYTARNIVLNDYYLDSNGTETALPGIWNVNGEETTGQSASVSPVAPCTVTYTYDPNVYVFVSSEPACLYNNETDGVVSFEEYAADQNMDGFSVELHKKSGDQEFDPARYPVEHADIVYQYQGVVIEDPIAIPSDGKITYEITNVEEGYWVPDSGALKGEIEVGSVAEITSNLVCKKEKVKVTLPQPKKGGVITYSLDGKTLTGESVETMIGSEIVMTFQCKNGWTCDAADGTAYTVTEKEVQRITVEGKDVNDIFSEQQYKPDVSITIDKSVGIYTEFSVSAAGIDEKESALKLEDPKKKLERTFEEVGTKDDLTLTASNGALLEGEALRIEIQKEIVNGSTEKDIRYLQKLPESLTISLYNADSSAVYKTVELIVSKVQVISFSSSAIANGSIAVETTDLTVNRYLRDGDVIEESRKVKLTISAKSGYYVKDSGKTEDYSDTMKYAKYVSDLDKINSKHPIKKLIRVTLDAADPYGTVTYEIDGKAVEAGAYALEEEQKLEMSYEITDGKHVIAREGEGLLKNSLNKVKSKTKETREIQIMPSLDGVKITRETYIKLNDK